MEPTQMNRSTDLMILILLILACYLGIQIVGLALSITPGFEHLDAKTALVYPDGDHFLVATSAGPYEIGSVLVSGCYRLAPAEDGAEYGKAAQVWFLCRKWGK